MGGLYQYGLAAGRGWKESLLAGVLNRAGAVVHPTEGGAGPLLLLVSRVVGLVVGVVLVLQPRPSLTRPRPCCHQQQAKLPIQHLQNTYYLKENTVLF